MAKNSNSSKNINKPADLINYENEIEKQKEEINKKITSLEGKLLQLQNKESIINNIITNVNLELEKADPKAFKLVGQLRNTLNHNFETLSLIMDMIFKIEDTIQKYRKMLIDVENQKINNIIKAKIEEEEIENDVSKILLQINNQINSANSNKVDEASPILQEALAELKDENY